MQGGREEVRDWSDEGSEERIDGEQEKKDAHNPFPSSYHTLYSYQLTMVEYNMLGRDDSFNIKYQCQET